MVTTQLPGSDVPIDSNGKTLLDFGSRVDPGNNMSWMQYKSEER